MFALGNSLFACDVRTAREWSFLEARSEMEVGRRWLPPPLVPEPCPLPLPATSTGVIFMKVDNSYCYASYSCGNNCNVVVKLVQEYHCFLYILLPFCGNSSPRTTFLGEANSYNLQASARIKILAAAIPKASSLEDLCGTQPKLV